jgi:hypothetical protein
MDSSSESDFECPKENEIDIIDVFLKEFKEYTNLYVIPEFGTKITQEKLYDFIMKNK